MFKQLFDLLFKLIFQPAKAWNILSEKQVTDNEDFFKSYLYPLFGMVALLSFLGIFFNHKTFEIQLALKSAIRISLTVFVAFYLSSFLLAESMVRFFNQEKQTKLCQRFVGYSSALVYVLYMLLSIFPEFFFFNFFVLYTIYMIWEGATPYMGINEDQKLKFVMLASAVILISPYLIEAIVYMLMPGLRS